MKTVAHQTRTAGKSGARPIAKSKPRPQQKSRPEISNHRRQNQESLERQANDLATRALRGETGLGRKVGRTAAANYNLPTSPGVPLQTALRIDFENLFGADFTAVRLHTDNAAGTAANREGAVAFASGRDIFFQPGAFNPQTLAGRKLLLHELTHVLQQTGRATSEGKIRATPISSAAGIQCEALPDQKTLRKLHAPKNKSDAAVNKFAEVATELDNRLAAANSGGALEDYFKLILPDMIRWPYEAESLLFDTLKREGKPELAVQILARNNFKNAGHILTAGWDGAFVSTLEASHGGGAVYALAAETDPMLSGYIKEILRRIELFIFGSLDAQIPDVPRSGSKEGATNAQTLNDHAVELAAQLGETKKLSSNEWIYTALQSIDALNQLRKSRCNEIDAKALKASAALAEPWYFRKRRRAEGIHEWGENFFASTKTLFADPGLRAGWEPFLRKIGKQIAELGNNAVEAWDEEDSLTQNLRLLETQRAKNDQKGMAQTAKALAPLKAAAEKVGLPQVLNATLDELNRPGAGNQRVPSAKEFGERAGKLVTKLRTFSADSLEKPHSNLLHEQKTEEKVAYFWLSTWLQQNIDRLEEMESRLAGGGAVAARDEIVFRRIRLARQFSYLAQNLGWGTVVTEAKRILEAEEETQSQLAILPYPDGKFWHRDDQARLDDLGNMHEIKGWEPVTGEQLVLLYRTEYYNALEQEIGNLVPKSEGEEKKLVESGGPDPFVAGRAALKLQGMPKPERWRVKEAEVAMKPNSTETFSQMIQRHDSYGEVLTHAGNGHLWTLLPEGPDTVFVWFLPEFDQVISMLRDIDLLNVEVGALLSPKGNLKEKTAAARKLDNASWFKDLTGHFGAELKGDAHSKLSVATLKKALSQALKKNQDQAWSAMLLQMKRGLRLDRQLLAKEARRHLSKYAQRPHPPQEQEAARDVLVKFFMAVSPLNDADADAEMLSLLLELAPDLSDAFEKEGQFEIIYAYLGFLELALKALPGFSNLSETDRRVFLPEAENNPDWIKKRGDLLEGLKTHFQTLLRDAQEKAGYKTNVGAQTLISSMKLSDPTPVGTKLYPREGQSLLGEAKAIHYEVTKIYRSYVYHPAVGHGGTPAADKTTQQRIVTPGHVVAKLLELDNKTPLALKPGEKLLEVKVLDEDENEIDIKQVGAEDTDLLDDINNGLMWNAFGSVMENTNTAVTWMVNSMLDAAEYIPGFGQGVTAARVFAEISAFWGTDEFKMLEDAMKDGIPAALHQLLEKIKNAADPDVLVQLLFFGNERIDRFLGGSEEKAKTKKSGSHPASSSGLLKGLSGIFRLGVHFVGALRWLNHHVQAPLSDLRVFVASRPVLSSALQFIANHVSELETIGAKGVSFFESSGEDAADEIKDLLTQQQEHFGEAFHGLLQSMESLQLPAQIIDSQALVGAILSKLESVVEGHLGTKGKAVFIVLQKTKALDFVNDRAANIIVGWGADPNIIWRNEIIPEIEGHFNDMRDSIVTEINQLIGSKVFGQVFTLLPPAAKMTLQPVGTSFPDPAENQPAPVAPDADSSPVPSADRPLQHRPAHLPVYGPGQPLDPRLRRQAEAAFGQDFGHVRLHSADESQAMTGAFGADGLATGSHVFLRPTLSPHSGRGREIFHHELVHVLQNSGTRPLGRSLSTQAIRGRPDLGLNYQLGRERVAEKIAGSTSRGQRPEASEFGSGTDIGLQPGKLDLSTVSEMLRSFTDVTALEHNAEQLDQEKGMPKLPGPAKAVVENALAAVTGDLQAPKTFLPILGSIKTRLNDPNYLKPITHAAYQIAKTALTDPSSPGHFHRKLEGYIFAKTGIALALKFGTKKTSAASSKKKGEKKKTAKTTAEKKAEVLTLYLPLIDGRSPLWIEVIARTWKGEKDEKRLAKIRLQSDALFKSKGNAVEVWAPSKAEYKFRDSFKKEVDNIVDASGTTLDPKQLPTWQNYADTNASNSSKPPIGLRLSTYGDDSSQVAPDRESHHLTQFLMADYFSNAKANPKPFKPGRDYPGVSWKDQEVQSIVAGPTGKTTSIDVATTRGTRGEKMPAISLAASTHRGGHLHLTPQPDDLGRKTTTSQGYAVDNIFTASLPKELHENASNADYKAYRAAHPAAEIALIIYSAAQDTYHEIEKRMSTSLKQSLPKMEFDYYQKMAASDNRKPLSTSDENHFKAALSAVPGKAKDRNKLEMGTLGWKL